MTNLLLPNMRAKLEQHLNAIWYPAAKARNKPRLADYFMAYSLKGLLLLAKPLSCATRCVLTRLRLKRALSVNLDYLKPLLKNKKLIIIGNITVGGTGKTPIVAKLYEHLEQLGYVPGLISKGYLGQKVSAEPYAVQAGDNPKEFGDEPVLLANKLKNARIMVCNNRIKAIQALLEHYPDVNIMLTDDGLQDQNLKQLVSVLDQNQVIKFAVIDSQRGLGNQKLLPEGPLREPVEALNHVNHVVIHETLGSIQAADNINIINNDINSKSIWLRSQIVSFEQVNAGVVLSPSQFAKSYHHVRAVTGIGHPERFFQNLRALGMSVKSTVYRDHVSFKPQHLSFPDELPIVITEKDAVKVKAFASASKAPIWVAKLDITGIEQLVQGILSSHPPARLR